MSKIELSDSTSDLKHAEPQLQLHATKKKDVKTKSKTKNRANKKNKAQEKLLEICKWEQKEFAESGGCWAHARNTCPYVHYDETDLMNKLESLKQDDDVKTPETDLMKILGSKRNDDLENKLTSEVTNCDSENSQSKLKQEIFSIEEPAPNDNFLFVGASKLFANGMVKNSKDTGKAASNTFDIVWTPVVQTRKDVVWYSRFSDVSYSIYSN